MPRLLYAVDYAAAPLYLAGPPPLLLAPAWVARSGGRMVPLGNAAGPLTFVTFTGAAAAVLEGDL